VLQIMELKKPTKDLDLMIPDYTGLDWKMAPKVFSIYIYRVWGRYYKSLLLNKMRTHLDDASGNVLI
jgi:hypothetical protein